VADLRNKKILDSTNDNMTGKALLDNAKLFEEGGDFNRAIDVYLEVSEKHFDDPNKLEEIWNKAISMAMQYDKNRAPDIVYQVALKLTKIGKYQNAAQLFESIGQMEEAINCYCEVDNYDRARKIAQTMKFGDAKDKLMAKIDRMEKEYFVKHGDTEGLLNKKDEEGLKMLMEKGEYEKCLEAAQSISDEMFNKYIINIVKKYLDNKNLAGTADFLEKHNTPIYEYNLQLYNEIAMEILADENLDELKALNGMLNCVNKQLKGKEQYKKQYATMSRLNNIAYYQYIKFTMKPKKESFPKSYYRVCETVLAFGDIIKFDLALLDAGLACRDLGMKGNALILLNRYFDVYDEIKDPDNHLEEEPELKDTEFGFLQTFKSQENIINESQREEIHQWIINTGVEKNISKTLNKKICPKCKHQNFEANTVCLACKNKFEICVITGSPIYPNVEAVTCSSCKRKGIKECWKEWVGLFQTCPNCQSVQMSYK
jgi:intraflagellar transport protein 172